MTTHATREADPRRRATYWVDITHLVTAALAQSQLTTEAIHHDREHSDPAHDA